MVSMVTFGMLAAGMALLIVGAEVLVRGASALATTIGISPLVVGLTVVAFGTSAPELAVGVRSGLFGEASETDIALGNVIGSNIANILLILGLASVVAPLVVRKQLLHFDVPLMIGASLLLFFMSRDGLLGLLDGLLLTAGIFIYTGWSIYASRKQEQQQKQQGTALADIEAVTPSVSPLPGISKPVLDVVYMLVGLLMLVFGSDWLVNGSSLIARSLGVSELLIGLTIVAVGTSLPEIATTIAATIRGERDMAVGNAVGSNLFNILLILGVTSLITPGGLVVSGHALRFDFPVMLVATLVCFPIFYTGSVISRREGAAFLFFYVSYITYMVLQQIADSNVLSMFSTMVIAVMVLTFIGLIVRSVQWFLAKRGQHLA